MDRLVPLSVFEHQVVGVVAVGGHAEVRFCNRAAARLLRCDPGCPQALTCWRLARLRTSGGEPFCAADCPIQREARGGRLAQCHRVRRVSPSGSAVDIELVTFLVPPTLAGRFPLLHFLRPLAATESPSPDPATGADRPAADPPAAHPPSVIAIEALSPREREVLCLLADGLDDWAIAERLFISPVTVRNHLQRILHKLGVHRRLDAALALLRQPH
jgi:DNA-binding CsgD family transcriptional regulator